MTLPQWAKARRTLVLLLAPFEPFLAEELWRHLGGDYSVHTQAWPAYDPAALADDEIEVPVQVNGKLRGRVTVPATADQQTALTAALALSSVKDALAGDAPKRVVFVPGRALNLVV
jgi:leucyl-tRNA synthetase